MGCCVGGGTAGSGLERAQAAAGRRVRVTRAAAGTGGSVDGGAGL